MATIRFTIHWTGRYRASTPVSSRKRRPTKAGRACPLQSWQRRDARCDRRRHRVSRECLQPFPDHDLDFEPKDTIIRACYRNQYAKSFPVIQEDGTIINGHKRIKAARVAGLERHPVEVINVIDEQAAELFAVAHRSQLEESPENEAEDEDPPNGTDNQNK